jgi:UPF0755 protein
MKKFLILILFVILIGALGLFGAYSWWDQNSSEATPDPSTKRFVITRGQSAEQIGRKLESEGLIKSALAFKIYVQVYGKSQVILPGEYEIAGNLTLSEVVEKLTGGPDELWVTIPEGLRREEYPDRFIRALGLTGVEADRFRAQFLSASASSEGLLFPDTYLFPKDVSGEKAVSVLITTFERRTSALKIAGNSRDAVVIKASLIEREAKSNEERPVVAGILENRLRIGMPLQIDATAQYAVASVRCQGKADCKWWEPPTREDLKIVSSYNTYVNSGLPTGPIANPGLESIKAVLNPTDTNYLYYIHSEGQIYYGRTLDEHNENIRRYLNR